MKLRYGLLVFLVLAPLLQARQAITEYRYSVLSFNEQRRCVTVKYCQQPVDGKTGRIDTELSDIQSEQFPLPTDVHHTVMLDKHKTQLGTSGLRRNAEGTMQVFHAMPLLTENEKKLRVYFLTPGKQDAAEYPFVTIPMAQANPNVRITCDPNFPSIAYIVGGNELFIVTLDQDGKPSFKESLKILDATIESSILYSDIQGLAVVFDPTCQAYLHAQIESASFFQGKTTAWWTLKLDEKGKPEQREEWQTYEPWQSAINESDDETVQRTKGVSHLAGNGLVHHYNKQYRPATPSTAQASQDQQVGCVSRIKHDNSVMLFNVGSTTALTICRTHGIDPHYSNQWAAMDAFAVLPCACGNDCEDSQILYVSAPNEEKENRGHVVIHQLPCNQVKGASGEAKTGRLPTDTERFGKDDRLPVQVIRRVEMTDTFKGFSVVPIVADPSKQQSDVDLEGVD